MAVVTWIFDNWPALISVIAMLLAVGVSIAHMAGQTAIADKIQAIEDVVNGLVKAKPVPPANIASPANPPAP